MATKYPPQLSLEEAIRVIKEMYARYKSREVSIDNLPEILQTKQSSSFFPAKIAALQRFAFVEKKPNDVLELTDLAMQIINPIEKDEDARAKYTAFHKIDVLSALLSRYPNYQLPASEPLQQTLLKEYQIPRERVKNWSDFVVASFRVLAQDRERLHPEPVNVTMGVPGPQVLVSHDLDKITLPSKKRFEYRLEEGYSPEDLDFIIRFFELMKTVEK